MQFKLFTKAKNLSTGIKYSGASLKSIITELDVKEGDDNLGNKISYKLQAAREKIIICDQNFIDQIQSDNNTFLQTYDAIKKL